MKTRWVLLIPIFSLVLGSCGGSAATVGQSPDLMAENPQESLTEDPTAVLPENPIQLASTPETTDMPSHPSSAEKFIQLAKRDLAGRLTIDIANISLIEAVEMTWPNAALGCPSPGKVYATVRVPGYRVKLEANGTEYIYNTDLTGQVILCPEVNFDENIPPVTPDQTQSVNPGVPIQ
jgi:hypothetical protein